MNSLPWHWTEVSGKIHASAALPPENSLWYILGRRLGGMKRQSECCEEEKDLLPLLRNVPQFLGCPSRSLIAIRTKLGRC
jgi:hypothetical protein